MSYGNVGNKFSLIEKEIFDPKSELYVDNLLDLACSIDYDVYCSGTWKNSKPIKAFLDRYSNFSDKVQKLRVSLGDFQVIKTVGQGGFGRVDLVKHKKNKQVYAMKIMEKSTFVQNSFNGFWEERDIMAYNSSDWLVKCFYTFMDLKKLYIVMEYMPGGDLYHWMTELEEFDDKQTHFYAMEIVLAIEILHNMGFLHRDLKPDNMLLDKNGHLKLADFGTCIRVKNGRIKTNFQVGTPDYICPEILRSTGIHDLEVGFEIDWWAFGIVIYELFYGETPFEGESTSTLYQNIMCYKKTLIYPDDKPAEPEFTDFISKILTEPNERMGISEVRNHPYLAKNERYKWNFSNIREHQTPISIFEVTGDDDTNYISFDPNDKRNNISSTFNNNNYFSGENLAFTGFTFNRFDHYTESRGSVSGCQSVSDLECSLSEMELAKHQLTVKLDGVSNELQKTNLKLIAAESELLEKESLMSNKKSELNQVIDANKQLKSKVETLSKQLELTQREIEQLKVALNEKETLIKNLKTEIGNLTDEISALQINAKAAEDKFGKLSVELEEKVSIVENLEKVNRLLDEEKFKNQALSQEISEKSRKISEFESQLELLKTKKVVVNENTESAELEQLLKEKQSLEIKLNHLNKELQMMEEMKNAVQFDLNQEKQKKLEVEKIRDKLSKDVTNQKLIVANFQSQINSLFDQKKVLRQKINVIESEKDQIEQQKKMFESMVNVLRTEKDELSAEIEETEENFEKEKLQMESENQVLQSKYNAIINECESLKVDNIKKAQDLRDMDLLKVENDHLFQRFNKIKSELDDSRQKSSELEKEVQVHKESLWKNNKERQEDKTKIQGLITKIVELSNEKQESLPRKKKDKVNHNESLRKIKQLESDLVKEKEKFQDKVKEINEAKNECQRWQDEIKELRSELENKNNQITDLTFGINNLSAQKQSNVAHVNNEDLKLTEMKNLEGRLELLKRSKGRHKITWIPSFGVLKPFKFEIFSSESDNTPIYSIDLKSIIHIREPSSAECVHVEKNMLPKILRIIYEKQENVDDVSRRQSTISSTMDSSRRNFKSSTLSIDETGNFLSPNSSTIYHRTSTMHESLPSDGIYKVENHLFVPMRFRSYTSCDLCQQQCSDLITPPPALECSNCKKRIHADHINSNDKKIQWCQGAINDLFLKVESKEVKDTWLNHLNQLKLNQKNYEVQVAPGTYFRSIRQPVRNSTAPNSNNNNNNNN